MQEGEFKLPTPFQCRQMLKNTNICSCFLRKIEHTTDDGNTLISKIITKGTSWFSHEGAVWGVFVSLNSGVYHTLVVVRLYIDGLVQERRNSSAMELHLSCTDPSI